MASCVFIVLRPERYLPRHCDIGVQDIAETHYQSKHAQSRKRREGRQKRAHDSRVTRSFGADSRHALLISRLTDLSQPSCGLAVAACIGVCGLLSALFASISPEICTRSRAAAGGFQHAALATFPIRRHGYRVGCRNCCWSPPAWELQTHFMQDTSNHRTYSVGYMVVLRISGASTRDSSGPSGNSP